MVIRSFPRRTVESFTADTRKPTLNPKTSPLLFSTSRTPSSPVHIPQQILLSVFPKNTMKRDESPPPNSKIFHVRPRLLLPQKSERISYIAEALNEEFNSIVHFPMLMAEPRTSIMYFDSIFRFLISSCERRRERIPSQVYLFLIRDTACVYISIHKRSYKESNFKEWYLNVT